MISICPLAGIGEVAPGDDLAAMLAGALTAAGFSPQPGDVLVVTQKIISKSQNMFRALKDVVPGEAARQLAEVTRKDARLVQLVLEESSAVVRAVPHVLITRHRSGHVMANAGIDRSNAGPEGDSMALLLPDDADAAAASLRAGLAAYVAHVPGVVISDSFGRPWRYGVVNVAIGAAGICALHDRRGNLDRDGRTLEVTQVALADMLASAAGLAMGEGSEGIPAVLLRGCVLPAGDVPASSLVRPLAEDLFQ